jgi:mono/diheme cytochrome c family protein
MRRTIARAAIALGLSGCFGSAYSGDAAMPNLKDPKVISAGHELFLEKHCWHCHGADGNGGVNLARRELANPNDVFEAIAEGREKNGLRMPAWRGVLTDTEIWETSAYVMTLAHAPK